MHGRAGSRLQRKCFFHKWIRRIETFFNEYHESFGLSRSSSSKERTFSEFSFVIVKKAPKRQVWEVMACIIFYVAIWKNYLIYTRWFFFLVRCTAQKITFSFKDFFIFVQWRWTEKDSGDEVDGIKNNFYGSHCRISSFKLPWLFESEAFRWHIDVGQH